MHPKSILIAFAHFVAIAAVGPPSPGYGNDLITEESPSIDRTASSSTNRLYCRENLSQGHRPTSLHSRDDVHHHLDVSCSLILRFFFMTEFEFVGKARAFPIQLHRRPLRPQALTIQLHRRPLLHPQALPIQLHRRPLRAQALRRPEKINNQTKETDLKQNYFPL